MSQESISKLQLLRERARQLAACRAFFAQRNVFEVDVPLLCLHAPVDLHIDLIEAHCLGKSAYLHSSPEYGMKKLLALGSGDIFQLSHVYRNDESGQWHLPEFMMAEWYRLGFTLDQLIFETLEFIRIFIDAEKVTRLTYAQAFIQFAGKRWQECSSVDETFAFEVAPRLGEEELVVLYDFPEQMAALSRLEESKEGVVAKRFEVLYRGIELANGYEELTDPQEQLRRLEEQNALRVAMGKKPYPIDPYFVEALKRGLPPCSGVACGFDRLMMLHADRREIEEVVPLTWRER